MIEFQTWQTGDTRAGRDTGGAKMNAREKKEFPYRYRAMRGGGGAIKKGKSHR